MIRRIIRNTKEKYKQKIRDVCGIDKINARFDTLFYFLDNSMDIRELPKATGNLRQLQVADTELLRIFHEVCKKHNLTYWMDYGTLLGSVRHKGFVPWDDDVDVCMPRKDYMLASTIIPEAFSKFGYRVAVKKCIYIFHEETGTAIDVFAMDSIEDNGNRDQLVKKIRNFKNYLVKSNYDEKREIQGDKEKMIGKQSDINPLYYTAPEQVAGTYIHSKETIFPLTTLSFEGLTLYAPNNVDRYLTEEFGAYMSFPRTGVLHHGNGGPKLYERAEMNNIDMDEFVEKLRGITIN